MDVLIGILGAAVALPLLVLFVCAVFVGLSDLWRNNRHQFWKAIRACLLAALACAALSAVMILFGA